MEIACWVVIGLLMVAGMFGAIYPIIPDSLLILGGAVLNHFVIPPPHAVGWWTLGIMGVLCVLAHIVDFTASAMGARRFGGTRWGAVGGMIGGIIGTLLFFPWGLFVGPVVGALCGEVIFAGRALGPAARSSWGTLLGTTAGMLGKIAIDATMVAVFCASLLLRV